MKGNIKLIDSLSGKIDHIQIKELVITKDDIFKFGGRDTILKNRPIVDMLDYNFFPRIPTQSTLISDIGIYKRLK